MPPNRQAERDKRHDGDWKKGDLAALTTTVDEKWTHRRRILESDEPILCKAVLAADRKLIGLKAVGMTGEYGKILEMAKAEIERDELRERLAIHSEECKAKDREAKNLTSERKDEIWEWKVTTAKAKKEMWSTLRSPTTNRSVPTAQSEAKSRWLCNTLRDMSNVKFQKYERATEQ